MEKTHAVYSTKTKIVRLIIWLFLAFVAIITIFPVCYVIFGSFKDNKELLVGGYKISGTASHVARTRILFHGTLLHRTDLGALDRARRGDVSKRGRKVASVPSPVMNLATLTGEQETTEHFLGRLTGFFENYYGTALRLEPEPETEAALKRRANELSGPASGSLQPPVSEAER